ncbi:MAG TPA: hypothetical protein DCZ43_08365, partial [candidate division Zixibacteria bacterium]|nr:hypothetical protein [candidate division Zixibacteria bacterium]
MAGNSFDTIFRDLLAGQMLLTGAASDFTLQPITVHILEMEDVLFHLNSAVMMPYSPAGPSSTQGGGATPQQEKISGI